MLRKEAGIALVDPMTIRDGPLPMGRPNQFDGVPDRGDTTAVARPQQKETGQESSLRDVIIPLDVTEAQAQLMPHRRGQDKPVKGHNHAGARADQVAFFAALSIAGNDRRAADPGAPLVDVVQRAIPDVTRAQPRIGTSVSGHEVALPLAGVFPLTPHPRRVQ